ncbi:MAG: ACT domain-containing protein [Clostridia bacterium]|nr:ACT domain-containing protein [Clostridia bacterium]
MENKKNLILVDSRALPSVFSKVLDVKKTMSMNSKITVTEATAAAGISRSAFYKYKDFVFPFKDMKGIITLAFELEDIAGILSEILRILAKANCNILTINQNIPINGLANITISIQNESDNFEVERFLKRFEKIEGIKRMHILAKD